MVAKLGLIDIGVAGYSGYGLPDGDLEALSKDRKNKVRNSG